jgi:K+-sensing histidine kinase KdpD
MVNSVVDDYESILQPRQQKISITKKSIPPAYVNPDIARLIFRNLLDNASKYSPKQSRIAIRLKATKDVIHIEVVDEGDGVSSKEIKQITDKKRTIQRPMSARADSNGLGLQLAFELADKIGAYLKVKRMNKKTIFSLTLPRAEQLELFPNEKA